MSDGTGGGWMQVRMPADRAERARRFGRAVLRAPFGRRAWAELVYFVVSSALTFAVVVPLVLIGAAGALLTVTAVGVLIIAFGLRLARGSGAWYRGIADLLLGEQISDPQPFAHPPGFFSWLRAALTDRAAWRAVAYLIIKVPLTAFGGWFALSIWLHALSSLVSPLVGNDSTFNVGLFGRVVSYDPGMAPDASARLAAFLAGVVFLFVAPWAMSLVVGFDRHLMHVFLGADAASSRVQRLEESRDRTVDAATETLRRIERNLHDGTQAQLVALAMRLGQAKDKLDNLDVGHTGAAPPGSADVHVALDGIRRLVDEAHSGAKEAITDLRDLARGIHPPALDTGLENALVTLAARSSVPTETTVSLGSRPSPAVETITYFCAAELLANVAQHAQASRASLSCVQHGPWLRVVVRDDGRGGAEICRAGSSSSGLAGLAERVGTVDGHLSIASPPGGPTAVTVDLPSRS